MWPVCGGAGWRDYGKQTPSSLWFLFLVACSAEKCFPLFDCFVPIACSPCSLFVVFVPTFFTVGLWPCSQLQVANMLLLTLPNSQARPRFTRANYRSDTTRIAPRVVKLLSSDAVVRKAVTLRHSEIERIHAVARHWILLSSSSSQHQDLRTAAGHSHFDARVCWCFRFHSFSTDLVGCFLLLSSSRLGPRSPPSTNAIANHCGFFLFSRDTSCFSLVRALSLIFPTHDSLHVSIHVFTSRDVRTPVASHWHWSTIPLFDPLLFDLFQFVANYTTILIYTTILPGGCGAAKSVVCKDEGWLWWRLCSSPGGADDEAEGGDGRKHWIHCC